MSAAFQLISENFINQHLVFKKSLLIAKNTEYIDLREVSYSKDVPSRPIFTRNGICIPSTAGKDLKDVLEGSIATPFKNRLCVRNHKNLFLIFVQAIDLNNIILTIKHESKQFTNSIFLTMSDAKSIIQQLLS